MDVTSRGVGLRKTFPMREALNPRIETGPGHSLLILRLR